MKHDDRRPNTLHLPKQVAPVERPATASPEGVAQGAQVGVDASGNFAQPSSELVRHNH